MALMTIVAGCGSAKTTTTIIERAPAAQPEWPTAAREAFMSSCHAGHGSQANCECLLHHEEAGTTVNDVLTKDQRFEESLHAAARECASAAAHGASK